MNGVRFDDVARLCALDASRRRVLRGLAGGALGTIALGLGGAAEAKKGEKGHKGKHRGFHFKGEGLVTSPGAEGCQTDPAGCVVTMEGDGNAAHIGKASFSGSLTVLWTEATTNPDGSHCAPATGETELVVGGPARGKHKGKKQGALTLSLDGTDCEVGGTGDVPHQFTGTYDITGGTGDFEGATGQGELEADNDGGDLTVTAKGTIHF